MFLTISDTLLLNAIYDDDALEGSLYGRLLDDGDVAQVWGLDASSGVYLGRWAIGKRAPEHAPTYTPSQGELLVLINVAADLGIHAFQYGDQAWRPISANIIRPYADYTARLRGLFEVDQLAERRVAVIGLGTGGGVVATQLARCGLGRMRLVDFDRLEVHNITRHVCGLADIGRYKTRAVADLLHSISPAITVEVFETDIVNDSVQLDAIIAGCDLVVAATDSEHSKLAINRACWTHGVPAVYGAVYNRAFGGDVFRAVPPDDACYECFHAAVSEFFQTAPLAASDFAPAYADPSRLHDLVAEPGLGMDTGVIALLLARMALMTLLRGATILPELPTNWLMFGNRAEWVFNQPLESLFVDIPKRLDCPICNYDAYVQQLGLTAEQAAEEARRILAQVPAATPRE
jgi:hypothetical protein